MSPATLTQIDSDAVRSSSRNTDFGKSIRICQLKTGDVFKAWGTIWLVGYPLSGRLWFKGVEANSGYNNSVGEKSQERVFLISRTKEVKKVKVINGAKYLRTSKLSKAI